jgi:predicted nucleic acid-binding protein
MKIAVKDANVFIDLEAMGLLDLWFQLGITTLTSSFVVMELEDGGHENSLACIRAGQVIEAEISGEEMAGAFAEFQDSYGDTGLSETDLSVIYLAIRENAMVLSGDRLLRTSARDRHLEIHGTLWIIDKLVAEGLLHSTLAADRLEALIRRTGSEQRFLPKAECESRISRWRRGR